MHRSSSPLIQIFQFKIFPCGYTFASADPGSWWLSDALIKKCGLTDWRICASRCSCFFPFVCNCRCCKVILAKPSKILQTGFHFNPRGKLVDNLQSKFKIIYRHHPARNQWRDHENMEISADTHMQAPTRSPRPTGIKAFHQHDITIDWSGICCWQDEISIEMSVGRKAEDAVRQDWRRKQLQTCPYMYLEASQLLAAPQTCYRILWGAKCVIFMC